MVLLVEQPHLFAVFVGISQQLIQSTLHHKTPSLPEDLCLVLGAGETQNKMDNFFKDERERERNTSDNCFR